MTRLAWCALAVALAAGQSLALPAPSYGSGLRRFEEMEGYQSEDTTSTSTATPVQEEAEQRLSLLVKGIHKQMQLQENMLRQLIREVQDYLRSVEHGYDVSQSDFSNLVNRMLEMMGNRLASTAEGVGDFMNNSGSLDGGAVREAARRFMKEASLQDVVIDAVWAALRGVQTSSWMAGIGAIENAEPLPVAVHAAEEFYTRVIQNMRTAGVSEEDMRKFVPRTEGQSSRSRKMGMRGHYGYGGYGYGRAYGYYGYGYPSYYSYGYSYPSYYSYGYAYPSYYSYGYPSYYGYSYPYYASYYYRRLRPNVPGRLPMMAPNPMMAPTPMAPPTPMVPPTPMGVPPFRSMYEEPMPVEPMMEGQGFVPTEYPMEQEVPDYMDPMMPTPNTFYEDMPTTPAYTGVRRSLAPTGDFARVPPETELGFNRFGFGPAGLPF